MIIKISTLLIWTVKKIVAFKENVKLFALNKHTNNMLVNFLMETSKMLLAVIGMHAKKQATFIFDNASDNSSDLVNIPCSILCLGVLYFH